MSTYLVTIEQTETVTFEVEAVDADEAAATYITDGTEVESNVTNVVITKVATSG